MQVLTTSIAEAAGALNLSRDTVRRLVKSGKLDSVLVGRRRLLKVKSVRQLAERGTVRPAGAEA